MVNYNKTITMTQIEKMKFKGEFDLCFYTYQGKLTSIIEEFNHIPEKSEDKKKKDDKTKQDEKIELNKRMVLNSFSEDKRNPLQIAAFLNFSNIFLYLLTYGADSGITDSNLQNTWHILAYRGHTKIMGILLNHIRYELKKESLKNCMVFPI